jgi:hypothetical protein
VSDVNFVATVCTLFVPEPSPLRANSTDAFVLSTLAGMGVVSKESELLRLFASAQIWICLLLASFHLTKACQGSMGEAA